MKNYKAKFISFEGGEGSGKSTQSKLLYEYLLANNIKAIHTREVGGTPEAEKIRDILIHSELEKISELLLVMSARFEHVNKVILPALEDNIWVICDRFIDSTAAYQSINSELSMDDIYELHDKLITKRGTNIPIMPDMTFYMNIEHGLALKRALGRGDANKFEAKNIIFHKKINENFKFIASLHSERIYSINCDDKKIQEIHDEILSKVFK